MTGKTKNTEFTEARIFAMSPKPANVCEATIHHASGIAYRGHFETPRGRFSAFPFRYGMYPGASSAGNPIIVQNSHSTRASSIWDDYL